MTPGSLRLFVAASLPYDQRRWVGEVVDGLRPGWPDARWIPLENQHVTLKFLGSVPEELEDGVAAACESVAGSHSAASLRLDGLGVFPSAKRARVLWVGLDDPDKLLASVAGALDERLAALGFEAESRPYSPHLTIARFRTPTSIARLPDVGTGPGLFPLTGFDLWRSHLSPKGARYERLASFGLGN